MTIAENYIDNIRNGLTLSGYDVNLMVYTAGYEEYFGGEAWMHLKLNRKSKKNDERVCALVDKISKDGLGFCHYDTNSGFSDDNKDCIAAYVFYLLDELARMVVEKRDGWDAIHLINELWWCMRGIDPHLNTSRLSAKKAVFARHKENRALKQQAFEWYQDHGHVLKNDDAAIEIIRLVPVSLRTAQDWVTDFRKKLRFARTT